MRAAFLRVIVLRVFLVLVGEVEEVAVIVDVCVTTMVFRRAGSSSLEEAKLFLVTYGHIGDWCLWDGSLTEMCYKGNLQVEHPRFNLA